MGRGRRCCFSLFRWRGWLLRVRISRLDEGRWDDGEARTLSEEKGVPMRFIISRTLSSHILFFKKKKKN